MTHRTQNLLYQLHFNCTIGSQCTKQSSFVFIDAALFCKIHATQVEIKTQDLLFLLVDSVHVKVNASDTDIDIDIY